MLWLERRVQLVALSVSVFVSLPIVSFDFQISKLVSSIGNEENVLCEKMDIKTSSTVTGAAPETVIRSPRKEVICDPLNIAVCQMKTPSELPAPNPVAADPTTASAAALPVVSTALPAPAAAPVPAVAVPIPVAAAPLQAPAAAPVPAVAVPIPVAAAPLQAPAAAATPVPAVAVPIPAASAPLQAPAAAAAATSVPAPAKVNAARIRCLEDPLFSFSNPVTTAGGVKGTSVASLEPVAPKGPRYRVLEAPSDEMNVSPTSLALSTSATSSPYKVLEAPSSPTLSSPSSVNRSLASDVLEKARTRFDRFWTKKECDK